MIIKIKGFFLLISLIFIQSCSGGSIGNFLESSFDNLEKRNKTEDPSNISEKKKSLNSDKNEVNKKNIKKIIKKDPNNISEKKKSLNSDKNAVNKKNIKKIVKEDPNNISEKKKFLNVQNNFDKPKNNNKVNSFAKKRKNELQSYKIIFILKDVDPKDPIEELSTILRNSEVNFEIEKIERFIDTKNNKLKRN